MSGKYLKKREKKNRPAWVAVCVCAAVLAAVLLIVLRMNDGKDPQEPMQNSAPDAESQQTEPAQPNEPAEPESAEPEDNPANDPVEVQDIFDLGSDVKITGLISYTGAFMEDRSDEVVSDVLAILVTNFGDEYIQTMDITLSAGEMQAEFSLSTLFPGETVVVLEKNRMSYSTAPEFEQVQTGNVALFDGHPGMCHDKLEIHCLDGIINITNISGQDISDDILVYYKNYVSGMYYGGITYRLRVAGGLKDGEIRQGTAAHFNPDNSTVVFVTCG